MLALARVALVRLVRDRTNAFFVVVFPLLLVLLIGVQFGGAVERTLVVAGDDGLGAALAAALDGEVSVELVADADAVRAAVRSSDADAGLVLPGDPAGSADTDAAWVALPDVATLDLRTRVDDALRAATAADRRDRALAALGVPAGSDAAVPTPAVATTVVGGDATAEEFAGLGQFDLGASQQLLLFVFVVSLTSSTAVVQARRWGVLARVLTGPTSPATVVAGLGLGQLAVALTQAVVVIAGSTLLFGVDWGDPVASGAVVLAFSALSAAAGLLLGALLDNEEQASGVGVPVALVLAALGGSMVPLDVFSPALATVARLTPHAWGNIAFAEIVRRDGGVADVLPSLGVLVGGAAVLGGAAAVVLRRRLAA